jgi:hypothetical protein
LKVNISATILAYFLPRLENQPFRAAATVLMSGRIRGIGASGAMTGRLPRENGIAGWMPPVVFRTELNHRCDRPRRDVIVRRMIFIGPGSFAGFPWSGHSQPNAAQAWLLGIFSGIFGPWAFACRRMASSREKSKDFRCLVSILATIAPRREYCFWFETGENAKISPDFGDHSPMVLINRP